MTVMDCKQAAVKQTEQRQEFNTWMRGIYPISCVDNIIKLSVDNEMCKYILENEYEPIILGAIKEITGKVYSIKYCR